MIRNLKFLRNKRKISQQQLAGVLGISQQSINKYENHNIEPDISTLIAMADYFNTSIDFLVGRYNDTDSSDIKLTSDEKTMLCNYRKLNQTEKICVDTLIKTYTELGK